MTAPPTWRPLPRLRPVRIRKRAPGAGVSPADLAVSPRHRIPPRSRIARKISGTPEAPAAAKQLPDLDGIDIAHDLDRVTHRDPS